MSETNNWKVFEINGESRLTNMWDLIQERNIDPNSPVDSDNHNKLLKILGSHKAYINGFDIELYRDGTNNRVLFNIKPGICVLSYMAIEFKEDSTIIGFQCPVSPTKYGVVVEYRYSKIKPAPVAVVKIINLTAGNQFDPKVHLLLATFTTGQWSLVPDTATLDLWFNKDKNYTDERHGDDNIPDWVSKNFVKKSGDTMTDSLILKDGEFNNPKEAVSKGYVTDFIKTYIEAYTSQTLDDKYLLLAGSKPMTGALILTDDKPTKDLEAICKKYVEDNFYSKSEGDKKSIDDLIKEYIENHDDEHNDVFIKRTGDTVNNCALAFTGTSIIDLNNKSMNLSVAGVGTTGTSKITGVGNLELRSNSAGGGACKINFYNGSGTTPVAFVNEFGIAGSLFNADMVEYFEHNLPTKPEHGTVLEFSDNGKLILASPNSTRVCGMVSYHPGFILGGDFDFDKNFEEGRIPVALVGQLKDVEVYSSKDMPPGTLLVVGDTNLTPVPDTVKLSDYVGMFVAKAIEPIKKGTHKIKVLVWLG